MNAVEYQAIDPADNFGFSYSLLLHFLSAPAQEGYIFAIADDQRFIPGINADLVKDVGDKGIKAAVVFLRTDTDEPIMYQVEKAGAAAQALVIANLDEIIKENEEGFALLTQLNFGRERFWALRIPILFWASERMMYLIANEAADLYSQRRHSTVHFTGKMDVSVAGLLPDREGWDAFLSTKESADLETNISILKKRLEGARKGGYPALRTLAEIVVPLAKDYARIGLAHEVEKLFSEYKSLIDQTDDDELLNEIAEVYKTIHQYETATSYFQRAQHIAENALGAEHPTVAVYVNNLAHLLYEKGRYVEAEPLLRRALSINEQVYGPEHPTVANSLSNLSSLLRSTKRFSEAEILIRKALEITEHAYGPEHPQLAIQLNSLSALLRDTGRLSEAEVLVSRALKIEELSKGADHPDVAISLNNLATLFNDAARFSEAEPLIRRALKIDEQAFGPDHPKIANRLNNLAYFFYKTNRITEAEQHSKRALLIRSKILGPEHPSTKESIRNYTTVLQATGKTPEEAAQIIQDLQSTAASQ